MRWTEAMRVVRADHPEVTIIMPGEKIQVHPGDDVRRLITPYVAVITTKKGSRDGKFHATYCSVSDSGIISPFGVCLVYESFGCYRGSTFVYYFATN